MESDFGVVDGTFSVSSSFVLICRQQQQQKKHTNEWSMLNEKHDPFVGTCFIFLFCFFFALKLCRCRFFTYNITRFEKKVSV
jgi:formate-dependent nitrite reductase membrane component NrfD